MFSRRRLLLALAVSALLHLLLLTSVELEWGDLPGGTSSTMPLQVRIKKAQQPALPAATLPPPVTLPPPATGEPVQIPRDEPAEAPDLIRKYYLLQELDEPPMPLEEIRTIFPEGVPAEIFDGWAKVEIRLNETGGVDSVEVLDAGPMDSFGEAAKRAVEKAGFAPGRIAGEPVASMVRMRILIQRSL